MPESLVNPLSTLPRFRLFMPDSPAKPFYTLPLIQHLFDALHRHELVYCLWKSNPSHIYPSFTGESDVDVLFDIRQRDKVTSVLQALGFKKFNIVPERIHPDIEDFIKLDYETGKLIHLHTHYRLAMGPQFSKNYRVGLEDELLTCRSFNEQYGVYVTSTAHQLLALYCNEALGLRTRNVILNYLFKKTKFGTKVIEEYNWLKARTSDIELQKLLKIVFKDHTSAHLLMSNGFDKNQLLKFRFFLKKEFGVEHFYDNLPTTLARWRKEFTLKMRKCLRRIINHPVLCRRMNPRGGMVIVLTGEDDSVKSAIVTNIRKTFEMKLDVLQINFGNGDERTSIAQKLMGKVKSLYQPEKKREPKDSSTKPNETNAPYQERKTGIVATACKIMEALLVANNIRAKLKRMKAANQKGMFVLCDQFPQIQMMGYNDGPYLQHLLQSRNPVFKWLAGLETRIYAQEDTNPPALLVKLITNSAVVEQRKFGEPLLEKLETTIYVTKQFQMQEACTEAIIDASQPFQDVLYDVRKVIWDKI